MPPAAPISDGMTEAAPQFTDARGLLYRPGLLDPDGARRLTAEALKGCDDGELYLQYRASESFGFDDGRLKTADYSPDAGFGLRGDRKRVVKGQRGSVGVGT